MSGVSFNIQQVEEKPRRKMRANKRRNKYESIIDAFVDSGHSLVRVEGTGLNPNYLRLQLVKALDLRKIDSVEASVRNGEVYLSKR